MEVIKIYPIDAYRNRQQSEAYERIKDKNEKKVTFAECIDNLKNSVAITDDSEIYSKETARYAYEKLQTEASYIRQKLL